MEFKSHHKIIFCIIILFLVLYIYYLSRVPGCMDIKALNYNPDANLYKVDSCVYETLGCSDPKAQNYNKWANTSCIQDCTGSNASKCDFTRNCSSLPQHLCKYKIPGCSRNWSENTDSNAIIDDNSCLTQEEFISRIIIMSGGACNGCSNKVYIKIDDEYIINGGRDGINMVVIDRNLDKITNKIIVRYIKYFNTAVDIKENELFVNFCKEFLYSSDIVLIAIKGDFIGQKDKSLQPVITPDSFTILTLLGGIKFETIPNSSYILIGTYLRDIYFESTNTNRDAYYPMINLVNFGCINIYDKKFVKKKLDIGKHLMLTTPGLETDEFIWRCALEVHSLGYDVFSIKGTDCYVVEEYKEVIKLDEIVNIYKKIEEPIFYKPKTNKFGNSSYIRTYLFNNYMAGSYENANNLIPSNISNSVCQINQFYQTTGNYDTENYYAIVDAIHSGLYLKDYASLYTYIYSDYNFNGLETTLESGIQSAVKIFSMNESAKINNGFETLNIESIKVPAHHYAIAFKTIFTDPTLNDNTIKEYYVFNGPNTDDLSKSIPYKKYPLIAKEQLYPTKISSLYIINGFQGINIFESNNYTGLVIRLAYGKYILPDLYIKPYYWKIKNMLSVIFNDLKNDPKIKNIYIDSSDQDITYQTILDGFGKSLPYTANQINAILQNMFKSLNYDNYIELADKYTKLVDGMFIGSIKSYIKANACIRFFSDTDFKDNFYTYHVQMAVIKPYDEIAILNNMPTNKLCKAIMVDKLGIIQIFNDINTYSTYPEITYLNNFDKKISTLVGVNNSVTILSDNLYTLQISNAITKTNNSINYNMLDPNKYTAIQTFNEINTLNKTSIYDNIINIWRSDHGIKIDDQVAVVRLKSFFDKDNINSYFFINQYKSLYEQFRVNIFNLLNFTNDDIIKLPQFRYYKNELTTDLPNPTINITLDDFIYPVKSGKNIKIGSYDEQNVYTSEETLLINNNHDSYFYNGNNSIVYLGTGSSIYIAQLPIMNEKIIKDFTNSSLKDYNINIKYGMIKLFNNGSKIVEKYYHIYNGEIFNGLIYVDYKLLSLLGYSNIIIYNLDIVSQPLNNLQQFTKNNMLSNKLNNIYGGLLVYDNENNVKKHIPIFRTQFWNNYQWINIDKIINYLNYDDINLSFYNLLNIDTNSVFICSIVNSNLDNINKIISLNNILNNLSCPCLLQLYFQPYNDDEDVLEQYDNFQAYSFRPFNSLVVFYSGIRMISVNCGNWRIKFEHELNNVDPIISELYIGNTDNNLVNKYDRSVYNGEIIYNYIGDKLVETITPDVFLSDSSYDHIFNVKKFWPSIMGSGLEPTFVEYTYKTSRWFIKIPFNLPTKTITWERYYG